MSEPIKPTPPGVNINGENCVTVEAAAEYLSLQPYEVRNLIHYHRRLTPVKVGIATLVTVDSLEREYKRRNGESTAEVAA